ncbi:MAG: hypothetical protein AAGK97_12440 [Bacteroidota bacterium]
MFGIINDQWIPIRIETKDNTFSIYTNDQLIRSSDFNLEHKRLVGFRFLFEGTGWLKDVRLNGMEL